MRNSDDVIFFYKGVGALTRHWVAKNSRLMLKLQLGNLFSCQEKGRGFFLEKTECGSSQLLSAQLSFSNEQQIFARLLNDEQALTSELKIVTREHSPLLIQNKLPIKQEFNDKVSISIEGEDGDLFYAKEVEDNSNLWQIDWINQPEF